MRTLRVASSACWARCAASAAASCPDIRFATSIPRIRRFGLQPGELLHHTGSSGRRILHHIPQRGRCADRGKYLAASRLDVPFQPFNRRMGCPIGGLRISQGPHGAVPFSITGAGRSTLGLEFDVRRFAAGFQLFQFSLEIGGRRRERRDLLRLEVQLLLPAADVELPSVRGLAPPRWPLIPPRRARS